LIGRKTRFSGEKRVHPACCRVFSSKIAFTQRVIAFFRRKTRFSGEKRVHPACCRVFRAKIAFIRRKSCFSGENHVFRVKIAFFA